MQIEEKEPEEEKKEEDIIDTTPKFDVKELEKEADKMIG